MFWWGFPVMCTGAVVFVIGLVFTAIMGILDIVFDIPGIASALVVSLDILGVGMAIIGFFCWCMGEIWSPYI